MFQSLSHISLLWNFSKYKLMLQHPYRWHKILGRTFQSINIEFIYHTRIAPNTVHPNGFQVLGKYSQPQNILCIKYAYQIKKVKFTPRTGHEGPPEMKSYCSTLYPQC